MVVVRHLGVAGERRRGALSTSLDRRRRPGLEAVDGVEPMSEGGLRLVVRSVQWGRQRELWVGAAQ